MKVKDAIKKLEKLNPDLVLVESGHDHDYLLFDSIDEITVGYSLEHNHLYEAWEEDQLIDASDKLVQVVLMGE